MREKNPRENGKGLPGCMSQLGIRPQSIMLLFDQVLRNEIGHTFNSLSPQSKTNRRNITHNTIIYTCSEKKQDRTLLFGDFFYSLVNITTLFITRVCDN